MIRFGICSQEDLTSLSSKGFLGRRKSVAMTLYPEIVATNDPDRDVKLQHILRRFAIDNGAFKWTESRRFEEFDAAVVGLVRERFDRPRPFSVHDVGASDGRTSVDFFRSLAGIEGLTPEFVASDLAPELKVLQEGSVKLVLDPETGSLLQVIRPPFVFNMRKRESVLLYPGNRLAWAFLARRRVRRMLASSNIRLLGKSIWLLAPVCLQLIAEDPRFTFRRHDVFERDRARRDLVRAMNILNRSYFRDDELLRVIDNVYRSLRTGGLLVTGSNQSAGSQVDGTVYERSEAGFRSIWTSGRGSQVDDLIGAYVVGPDTPPPEKSDVLGDDFT